ncbi:MAG: hypothetical protein NT051_05685 [Candidatus Micrarchaeota archaeon]|nr:hypothetical protein [Candidatus Micrarchaeota archaeon]
MEGENRLYTILSLSGGLCCLAAAAFFGSATAAALGALFFLLSIVVWKYGYALAPVLFSGAKVVEVGRNFEIPPSQDAIVGIKNGKFLATAFLSARLYDSASEKGREGAIAMGEMFERAVSSAGFPFKVCAMVCPLDLKNEMDEIRAKRSIAETRLERLSEKRGGSAEAARLEREIAMWNRQIESLTGGQRPLDVVFYLSTTGSGLSKEEALSRARAQADELSVVMGSALSCEIRRLKGEEMKRCFWWDFFGPTDSDELADEVF